MWHYRIYGLVLGSDQPLHGLVEAPSSESVDIHIELAGQEDRRSPASPAPAWPFLPSDHPVDESGVAIWQEPRPDGVYVRILYYWEATAGHTEFAISPAGDRIWGTWVNTLTEDAVTLLLGAVIACVLRLRGLLCLHGSVVRIQDHAIAILGDKGMGKSTTAAALAQRGHPLQADDIAVLGGQDRLWTVESGEPRLRLWPSSLEALSAPGIEAPPLLSIGGKRALRLKRGEEHPAWRFHEAPLPLAAIYILEPRRPDPVQAAVEPLAPTDALMRLLSQISARKLPLVAARKAREFEQLRNLALQVPIRRVQRPDDLDALPALCDALLSDTTSIVAGGTSGRSER